jgi:hypothetical protein
MTVSEQEIAEIEERWAKASKGPWHWTLDESNKHVTLFNIGSMVVMDFVRWGMNSCVTCLFDSSSVQCQGPFEALAHRSSISAISCSDTVIVIVPILISTIEN